MHFCHELMASGCGNFFSSGISNPMGEGQNRVGAWESGGMAASGGEESVVRGSWACAWGWHLVFSLGQEEL